MKRVLLLALCLVATSCAPRYADFFPYFDNGTKKPSFTLMPVFNETDNPLVANFPTEMSKAVRNRLRRTGKTYSPPISEMERELNGTSVKQLINSSDLSVFTRFKATDFVVLIETIECTVSPYVRGAFKPLYPSGTDDLNNAKVLSVAMRLEIINMKGKTPAVARVELVKTNHMLSPRELERANQDPRALELVRSRIAQQLAQKIEETVCVKQ